MLADLHTHSCFSFDAPERSTVTALCEAALERGLTCLAITDHCDINGEGASDAETRAAAFAEMSAAKARYEGKLTLLRGIELGQPAQFPDEARAILAEHPYDFVLGSLHNFKDVEDFYYMNFSSTPESDVYAMMERVLEELGEMCEMEILSSLAHITYPHRYLHRDGRTVDLMRLESEFRTLFQKMIAHNVALEVNTSTLEKAGFTLPSREVLALYRACGGRLLTLGSDAHDPKGLTRAFPNAIATLRELGFTELCFHTASTLMHVPL